MIPLLEQLKNPDFRIRVNAVKELGNYNDVRCITRLIEAFQDGHGWVRIEATNSLVRIGEASIQPLIESLTYSVGLIPERAIHTLGKIGAPAIYPLINTIIGEYPIYRRVNDRALIEIGKPVIEPLTKLLDAGKFPDKERMLRILREIEKPGRHSGLLTDSEKKDTSHEYSESDRIFILKLIEDDIMSLETFTNLVKYIDDDFKIYLVASLEKGNNKRIPFLLTMLEDDDPMFNEFIKSTLINMCKRPGIGVTLLGELYEAKKNVNTKIRKEIDDILTRIRDGS